MQRNGETAVRPFVGAAPRVCTVGLDPGPTQFGAGGISASRWAVALSSLGLFWGTAATWLPQGVWPMAWSPAAFHARKPQAPHQPSSYSLWKVCLKIGNGHAGFFFFHEYRPKITFLHEQALEWNRNKISRGQLFPAVDLQGFQKQQIHTFHHTELDGASQRARGQEVFVC